MCICCCTSSSASPRKASVLSLVFFHSCTMLTQLVTVALIILPAVVGMSPLEEACADRFCPSGTFCDLHNVVCIKAPCNPMTICRPDSENGCAGHPSCPEGQVCVEHRTSCISRSCKKEARCAVKGTCDALECPPSQKCTAIPEPHCIKTKKPHKL